MRKVLAFALCAGGLWAGCVGAAMVTKTNATVGYVDGSGSAFAPVEETITRDVVFDLADFGGDSTTILDIDISVSFLKSVAEQLTPIGDSAETSGGSGPFYNELQIELMAPDSTVVVLIVNDQSGVASFAQGGFDTFFRGRVDFFLLDGESGDAVNQASGFNEDQIPATTLIAAGDGSPTGFDPTGAPYKPASNGGTLDQFLGINAVGTWTLSIKDNFPGDGATFYDFSVKVTTQGSGGAAPVPGTLALFGVAVLGGAGFRRRHARAAN